MSALPDADGGEFYHSRMCATEFVVAGCNSAVVFEMFKEALDRVAGLVEHGREADRRSAVTLWRDGGRAVPYCHHVSQPIGIISLVGHQHLAFRHVRQQRGGGLAVMNLIGFYGQHHGLSPLVGRGMNFCCKTTPAWSETTIRVASF